MASISEWGAPTKLGDGDLDAVTKGISNLGTEEEVDLDFSKPLVESNLVESKNDVQVFANTEQAHLYTSATTFEELGLSEDLLKGIYSLGFVKPSKIQERALPMLLANPPRNMIAQSQSGTGKTAAFTLGLLSRIDISENYTQAICVAPSRELARQIMDTVEGIGKYTKVTTAFAIRESIEKDAKVNAQVIVGTPGTILGLIKRKQMDVSKVKVFVLDEADNMVDAEGLGEDSAKIRISLPSDAQVLLFSATFNPLVRDFAVKMAPNANRIVLKADELSVDGIKQFYIDCTNEEEKSETLLAIYGLLTIGQSMIFCRTRATADKLGKLLTDEGHVVSVLHGKLESDVRDKVIDDFRDGKVKVIITTNVIARGIDIRQVNLVINYDIPVDQSGEPDFETYLHRIGRTGRFGRMGVSINFVHDKVSKEQMDKIESHFKKPIIKVPGDDYEELESILKKALK